MRALRDWLKNYVEVRTEALVSGKKGSIRECREATETADTGADTTDALLSSRGFGCHPEQSEIRSQDDSQRFQGSVSGLSGPSDLIRSRNSVTKPKKGRRVVAPAVIEL